MEALFLLEANPILPHHPIEIIAGALLLACLWLLFARVISPKLEKNYQDRASQIQGGIERAQQAQTEAETAKKHYEELLAEARTDAARIREDAKNAASEIVAEAKARARSEAEALVADAHTQIHAELDYTISAMKHEVGDLAIDLAGRILGESLTDDDLAHRTVDRFLADLSQLEPKRVSSGADQL